ncbi:hypothetical protein Q4520_08915 [Alteromonas sp. 1_MG-2023]|uniref:hypothetical protein n=1 Tax=Alteromonas sp. 1_MG-2023 TaxID=3062669 RepID=UPI0026E37919|nr:hypothetical protein [Alteromonas sp. 1_MG-2023]MDO6475542.1 hypothetical protein [Alteromonas sp. 1_MG-2023]
MKNSGTALARLRAALERLITGKPKIVSASGKLTLNRINNEAGLGHSYIHKFEDFVKNEANPAIEKFNASYDPIRAKLFQSQEKRSEEEKQKIRLKKEIKLKEQYRQERDDLKKINKELETQLSSLIFRLYELQEQLEDKKIIEIKK